MSQRIDREEEIFAQAMQLESLDSGIALVKRECAGDNNLQFRLINLLARHHESQGLLDSPPAFFDSTVPPDIEELVDATLGPYKLLQKIGEGGMGAVYMAEQTEPVERRVAVKIIKPGMDTRQVIARFEAERQALAMMDHPNIARVLDAGTTKQGRPYFVMELVKGVPITTFCDSQHLTPRERLELIIPVCHAVQHAHQKGIIHRDLKPSNILVALYDGRPVPKVIDFGVAKATGGRLTDKTMYTQLGQVVGTLEYMSPEQAHLNQLDVDTRSDIYSLGAVIYEILTGTTPFTRERLRSVSLDEVMQIIREEDPPAPSTRLSTTENLARIAANRHLEPKHLSALVRGELDWIVMKTLEKDRARRYETANGLAMDIQRYLNDETVLACPPSKSYLLRKFTRKHKTLFRSAALIATVLFAATIVSGWQSYRATQHAKRADIAEKETRLEAKKYRLASELATQNLKQAQRILYEFVTDVSENRRYLATVPGAHQPRIELLNKAKSHLESFVALNRDHDDGLSVDLINANLHLSIIHSELGELAEAESTVKEAIALAKATPELDPALFQQLWVRLGTVHYRQQNVVDAIACFDRAIADIEIGQSDPKLITTAGAALHNKALIELGIGRVNQADRSFRKALDFYDSIDHADLTRKETFNRAVIQTNLARRQISQRNIDTAKPFLDTARQTLAQLNDDHPDFKESAEYLRTEMVWAQLHYFDHQEKFATEILEDILHQTDEFVDAYPDIPDAKYFRATLLAELAKYIAIHSDRGSQEQSYDEALEQFKQLAIEFPDRIDYQTSLGETSVKYGSMLRMLNRRDEALKMLEQANAAFSHLADQHPEIANFKRQLSRTHLLTGIIYRETQQYSNSEEELKTAKLLFEQLVVAHPDTFAYSIELVQSTTALASLAGQQGETEKQMQISNQALELINKLRIKHPENRLLDRLGLEARYGLATAYLDDNQFSNAETMYLEIVASNPAGTASLQGRLPDQTNLAGAYVNLAKAQFKQDKFDPALAHVDKGLDILAAVLEQNSGFSFAKNFQAKGEALKTRIEDKISGGVSSAEVD